MSGLYDRTLLVLGEERLEKLKGSKVMVIGLGGVGSYLTEALARCGVGEFCLVDGDTVCESNLNRQLYALNSTLGQYKANVAKTRILDINPEAKVKAVCEFITAENIDSINFSDFDYIADAIDGVESKAEIISRAKKSGTPVISCMGTGNKLRPELLEVADIGKTAVCPLARAVRRALRERDIESGVATVFSTEKPVKTGGTVGSVSFVPPAAGLRMASVIIRELIGLDFD